MSDKVEDIKSVPTTLLLEDLETTEDEMIRLEVVYTALLNQRITLIYVLSRRNRGQNVGQRA